MIRQEVAPLPGDRSITHPDQGVEASLPLDTQRRRRRSTLLLLLLIVLILLCICAGSWVATIRLLPSRVAGSGKSELLADYRRWEGLKPVELDVVGLATAALQGERSWFPTLTPIGTAAAEQAATSTSTPTPPEEDDSETAPTVVVITSGPTSTPSPTSTSGPTLTPPSTKTPTPTPSPLPTDTPVANADLALSMTDVPDPVTVGDNVMYIMTVTNNGPALASGVILTESLPGSVTFVSGTPSQGTCSQVGGIVTCNLGSLNSGASTTVNVVITTTASGLIASTAAVTAITNDPNTGNNSASVTTTVNPLPASADLLISKSDAPDPVTVGDNLTYTLNVFNNGPATATSVTLTDTLPTGVTFVSAVATPGTCNQAGGVVTCSLGDLSAGSGSSVTIVVTPTAAGMLNNTASVSSGVADPNTGNNSSSATTTVNPAGPPQADLAVMVDNGETRVWPNRTTTYTVTITNNGPDATTGVLVQDTLTAAAGAITAINWTCSATPGSSCTTASGSGSISQNIDLLAGGTITFQVSMSIAMNAGGNLGAPYSVTYSMSATGGSAVDPAPANNTASDIDPYHTVQFILDWSGSRADMDLRITDPGGYVIYYGAYVAPNASPTGGSLNQDTNASCPGGAVDPASEAITYPNGGPAGSYTAQVSYYQTCTWSGPINWTLTLLVDGTPTVVANGTINTNPGGPPATIIWSGPVALP